MVGETADKLAPRNQLDVLVELPLPVLVCRQAGENSPIPNYVNNKWVGRRMSENENMEKVNICT